MNTHHKKSRSSERDFLSKPIGLVYHHAESVYIINSLCELYLITPLGVYQKTIGLMICKTKVLMICNTSC